MKTLRRITNGYWMKPAFVHQPNSGGNLILGPVQINWYASGLRVHLTWPTARTLTLR